MNVRDDRERDCDRDESGRAPTYNKSQSTELLKVFSSLCLHSFLNYQSNYFFYCKLPLRIQFQRVFLARDFSNA